MTTSASSPDPTARIPLPGSEPAAACGLEAGSTPLDPEERVELTLVLKRRAPLPATLDRHLTRVELATSYGADPAAVEQVVGYLTSHGVDVIASDPGSRRVRITGPLSLLAGLFGADMSRMSSQSAGGQRVEHRHQTGGLTMPGELAGLVTAVLGFDDRPQARAWFRVAAASAVSTSYTPVDLAKIYDFPEGDGTGQTIAIIELGGGFAQSDLDAYFGEIGVAVPTVTAVGVDGAVNTPGQDPQGADAEVLLDIEVAGGIAPASAIVVYFAPNTDAGFLDAVSQAAHADPAPCAMSISWGQSEDDWTAQARSAMDEAFADAAALGVTVTVAAGDDGSDDRESDGSAHVDFPASSPHALGCGGTTLAADPATGEIQSETVWNDGPSGGATGGGVSDVFALPDWQQGVGVPARDGSSGAGGGGRGVPDVAAVADPRTGYKVRVDGSDTVIGGTSAVAPLWAGLLARLAQLGGKPLGLAQPQLYAGATEGSTSPAFRDITSGSNGAYDAAPGWDPCTGLGVAGGTVLTSPTAAPGAGPTAAG